MSKKELLEEIYKNVRWNGDILEKLSKGNVTTKSADLIGDRPPERPK